VTQWYYVDECWDIGFTAALDWTTLRRDGFTESGGVDSFQYDSASADALWGTIGLRAKYRALSNETAIDFNGMLGFETRLAESGAFTGTFVNDASGRSFDVETFNRFDDDALIADFDVSMRLGEGTTLRAGAAARFASGGQDYTATLGLFHEW